MPNDIEYKRISVPFEYEGKELVQTGAFSGYGSVFDNIDYDRDIIVKGAFKKTLAEWKKKKRFPPVLWQHRTDEPVGPHTDMAEDDVGLKTAGLLLVDDIRRAREARALMVHKAIDGLSIGYITRNAKPDRTNNTRIITEIELLEVSIVTMAANPKAMITDVKGKSLIALEDISSLTSLKEYEELLREAGFSRSAATAFVAKCRKQGEPGGSSKAVDDLLKVLKVG